MDTQNTPIHLHLWHRGFWCLSFAGMLLTMSAMMLVPTLPLQILSRPALSPAVVALSSIAFAVGLFFLGGFCNYLVERYRRNHVCLSAIVAMMLSLLALYFLPTLQPRYASEWLWLLLFVYGTAFGLSQIILTSTLIIDTCESFQRTEANHAAAWFRRFALSLGPAVALPVYHHLGFQSVLIASAASALLSLLLIMSVEIPFRAPDDNLSLFSLDRFLLPQSHLLSATLMLITLILGLLLSLPNTALFYGMMMIGFFLAILAEKYAFANAELKSETVSGLIAVGAAWLLLLTRTDPVVSRIVPILVGFGFGIIGSRFLLFFIKLSRHCQRGTSQSTFLLSWTAGLMLGIAAGYLLADANAVSITGLVLTVIALLFYNFVTHPWYLRHKNR